MTCVTHVESQTWQLEYGATPDRLADAMLVPRSILWNIRVAPFSPVAAPVATVGRRWGRPAGGGGPCYTAATSGTTELGAHGRRTVVGGPWVDRLAVAVAAPSRRRLLRLLV